MDSPPADEEFVMADDAPAFVIASEPVVEKWFRLVDLPEEILADLSEFLTLDELKKLKFQYGNRYLYSTLKVKIQRNHIIINCEKELFFYLYPSIVNRKLFIQVQEVTILLRCNIPLWMEHILANNFKVPKLTMFHGKYYEFTTMFSLEACTELNLVCVDTNTKLDLIHAYFPNLKKLGMFSSLLECTEGYPSCDRIYSNFYGGFCFKQLETILFPSALNMFPSTTEEFSLFDAQFPAAKYFQEFNRIWRKERGTWTRESEEMELEIKITCKKRKFTSDPKKKELRYCSACKQRTDTYHLINNSVMCVTCLVNPSSVKTTRELFIQCQTMKKSKPESASELVYQTKTSIVT